MRARAICQVRVLFPRTLQGLARIQQAWALLLERGCIKYLLIEVSDKIRMHGRRICINMTDDFSLTKSDLFASVCVSACRLSVRATPI